MAVAYVVVVPHRHPQRPSAAVYARRRWVAGVASVLLVLVVLALFISAGSALADRGGAPASTPTVRPADPAVPAAPTSATYLVLPGDSLWSIAARFHGQHSRRDYLERLIEINGGTKVYVGQTLRLP
jgi:nucleoid-associated protein YgaU